MFYICFRQWQCEVWICKWHSAAVGCAQRAVPIPCLCPYRHGHQTWRVCYAHSFCWLHCSSREENGGCDGWTTGTESTLCLSWNNNDVEEDSSGDNDNTNVIIVIGLIWFDCWPCRISSAQLIFTDFQICVQYVCVVSGYEVCWLFSF